MTKLTKEDIISEQEKRWNPDTTSLEFWVRHNVIYRYTYDIPTPRQRLPYIGVKCVEVLKNYLMKDAFILEKIPMK